MWNKGTAGDKENRVFDTILWDVDGTLINFEESERVSLRQCFLKKGISLSESDLRAYGSINQSYWRQLEKGEVSRQQVLEGRFLDFFTYLRVEGISAADMNDCYQEALGENCVMNDDAFHLCLKLRSRCHQYVVSNGTSIAQRKKLKNTGLDSVMDGIFISEEIGFQKPDVRFFEACFEQIPELTRERTLIVGDSLTSDIKGGNNAGIRCCWYRPGAIASERCEADYVIQNLWEILELL